MTKRPATICLMTMFLVGLTALSAEAQHSDKSSLKGIIAVSVVVEELPDGARILGLSKDAIQMDVDLKLRRAGMRVVTQEESDQLPGRPFVYVNVNLTDDARAADFDIYLDQDATLEQSGQFARSVATWETGAVISNPTAQLIRDQVKDKVDQFLSAWLSVNPRK